LKNEIEIDEKSYEELNENLCTVIEENSIALNEKNKHIQILCDESCNNINEIDELKSGIIGLVKKLK